MSDISKLSLRFTEEAQIRDFVTDLYRIFHRREPDPVGHAEYVNLLKKGTGVAQVLAYFANSGEFLGRVRHEALLDLSSSGRFQKSRDPGHGGEIWTPVSSAFPEDYAPPGEAGRSYLDRLRSGFLDRYCSGPLVLDVGYAGYDNPDKRTALPNAIGIDLEYPGYDGLTLPFADASVDAVFSSHCLEHIQFDHAAIRDWHRVLKTGGFIVCIVPSQALYEKRRFLPSRFNADHKRMYTPANLVRSFEEALAVNSYRLRHLAENDRGFNYALGPDVHSDGAYEIELVIEKITPPAWGLD
jgi:SAM-dependent methyltransferase